MLIEQNVLSYLQKLIAICPEIDSIWLFGSRTNSKRCPVNQNSDWDFFVFANTDALRRLRKATELNRKNIDLLVVYNGNDFKSPWNGKHGNLKDWKWQKLSPTKARYKSDKKEKNEKVTRLCGVDVYAPDPLKLEAIKIEMLQYSFNE